MKFFENNFTYDYSFPAVSLAYFLRYPNPYSRHVLTTDVIDRHVDPTTGRLHSTRLHLKRSKIPSAMLKLLPKGISGAENSGQSFILETSVVDVKEGWMRTESRNMEWTGILSVVEKQDFRRLGPSSDEVTSLATMKHQLQPASSSSNLAIDSKDEKTAVKTKVIFRSRLGQVMMHRAKKANGDTQPEEEAPKRNFLASWSTAGIQRTIEIIGVKRTSDAVMKSKKGMNIVLERMRHGGIVGVLEGMRHDREASLGNHDGPWKRVWLHGNRGNEHVYHHSDSDHTDDDA
ncbi:hypothetical protein AJ80_05712 [Polytolypa hystricis UAMH7299]|uniref:PRELI/MSF1 domain-containing protein n=1 Tax=Polytolypa hystricis (strain UAMH7299) TaxID=1447883 RepID=A0A2B7Y1A4_POLH7|nr:hypothetical protein AJ80_05712 [Polytolypa hystricis UAMH7299]